MRYVILGGGGIGTICAAFLTRAGEHVTLVTRGDHLDALKKGELTVTGLADFSIRVDASDTASGSYDMLIVATKAFDTMTALRAVDGATIQRAMSLQNGLRKNDLLASALGHEKIFGATTMLGATRTAPGSAKLTLDGMTTAGPIGRAGPEDKALVDAMARGWERAGLKLTTTSDIIMHEWTKQVLQAGTAPLAALTQSPTYKLFGTDVIAGLFVAGVREAERVARAAGVEIGTFAGYGFNVRELVELPMPAAIERVVSVGRMLESRGQTEVMISMAVDVRHHRRTELEETTGVVLAEAAARGIATPVLNALYRLVKEMSDTADARPN